MTGSSPSDAQRSAVSASNATRPTAAPGDTLRPVATGGVLADRQRSPVLTTRGHEFSSWTRRLLRDGGAWNVLRAYVMGGEAAVSPDAANALAAFLLDRQDPD